MISLRWKRILYWVSIAVILIPVLHIDVRYILSVRDYLIDHGPDAMFMGMASGGFVIALMQILAALMFIRTSRRKQFRYAFKCLILFAMTGFVVLALSVLTLRISL